MTPHLPLPCHKTRVKTLVKTLVKIRVKTLVTIPVKIMVKIRAQPDGPRSESGKGGV